MHSRFRGTAPSHESTTYRHPALWPSIDAPGKPIGSEISDIGISDMRLAPTHGSQAGIQGGEPHPWHESITQILTFECNVLRDPPHSKTENIITYI